MNKNNKARLAFNNQVRHRIRIVMAIDNIGLGDVSKKTQIAYASLNQIMNNQKVNPKLGRVATICQAIGFDLDALLGTKSLFASKVAKRVLAAA